MVRPAYVPDAGDLLWLNFDSQAGREQRGRRPVLVLSPKLYNAKSGLAVLCPITSQAKGYPFEVAVAGMISGVVLSDQVRSMDWSERKAERAARASAEEMRRVREKLRLLLGME